MKDQTFWQNKLPHGDSLWWRRSDREHWYQFSQSTAECRTPVSVELIHQDYPQSLLWKHMIWKMFWKNGSHKPLRSTPFPLHVCLDWNCKLCEEIPKEGFDPPHDYYGRPLKALWFRYLTPPSKVMEQIFLESLEQVISSQPNLRKRLMPPFPVYNATELNPFLSSLNALLVVTGFCHAFTKYCQDKLLLGVQRMAKESKARSGVVSLGILFMDAILRTIVTMNVCFALCWPRVIKVQNKWSSLNQYQSEIVELTLSNLRP